jgi:MprA protease rhombosortase-interaction domain-containing protein
MELINEKSTSKPKKNSYPMIASISAVSLLAAGTLVFLLRKRKRN